MPEELHSYNRIAADNEQVQDEVVDCVGDHVYEGSCHRGPFRLEMASGKKAKQEHEYCKPQDTVAMRFLSQQALKVEHELQPLVFPFRV